MTKATEEKNNSLIVKYMTPPKPEYIPKKYSANHPHGTVSGFVVARPKGVIQCL
jgi:hypothetical protein